MDSCKKRNRVHSNHYGNYQPNYCDESSPRESFDGNYARSLKSNSESPNSHRPNVQSTFECKVCLNTYQSNKDLYAHLHAAQHLRPLSRLNVPEDEETFPYRKRKFHGISCKVCFYEFDTQNELKRHLSESGHHWTSKRAKQISNLDRSACNNRITL
jgi:rubredoxin